MRRLDDGLDDGPTYERSETHVDSPAGHLVNSHNPIVSMSAPLAGVPVQPIVSNQPVVTVTPVAAMPVATRVQRTATTRFAPDAIIAAVAGLVLLLIGLVAVTRAGFGHSMERPIVNVLGITHTARLGAIEIAIGACLLLAGAYRSRAAAVFIGAIAGIGAFVGAVQTTSFRTSLALESGFAWVCVIGAVVVVAAALALPRIARSSTYVGPAA